MWSIRAHGVSKCMFGQHKRHIVYQNKNMWSFKTEAMFQIYRYQLKVNCLSFYSKIVDTFMIVLASYVNVEDIYGINFAIFIIFMTLENFIKSLRNLLLKFLLACLLHAVNLKQIGQIVFV